MKTTEQFLDMLSQDIDPAKFVLEERTEFLHIIKRLARSLSNPTLSSQEPLTLSRTFATDFGNYRLALASLQHKTQGYTRGLFDVLMVYMNLAWNERDRLGSEVVVLADGMALAYQRLADYLSSERSER
jgi:hypothetical protein